MTETAQLGDDVASAPLVGRRALVTGGSRGIGAGIVRRLAADGAAVAFTYREAKGPANDLEQEIVGSGGMALAMLAIARSKSCHPPGGSRSSEWSASPCAASALIWSSLARSLRLARENPRNYR